MNDVSPAVLRALEAGSIETVNLMEWLAVDMGKLARSIALTCVSENLRKALLEAAEQMAGRGIIGRLSIAGKAIASSVSLRSSEFEFLASHKSDLVRQWACYAANEETRKRSIGSRLTSTLRFAADRNMSVRETAWMAFRPHLRGNLQEALLILEPVTRAEDENLRRFAIEVSRPRSVWGLHIEPLKRTPALAVELLDNVRQDQARYVQLAAGNWLNDASKTRPDWVIEICSRWKETENRYSNAIMRRGLRTIVKGSAAKSPQLDLLSTNSSALNALQIGRMPC